MHLFPGRWIVVKLRIEIKVFGNGCCSRASEFVVFLAGLGYCLEFMEMNGWWSSRVLGSMVVVE